MSELTPFMQALLECYPGWNRRPVIERSGEGWHGLAMAVPSPLGSDLAHPLEIDETGNEVTITLDYCHIHITWPAVSDGHPDATWWDPMRLISAILDDHVVVYSAWTAGRLKASSFHRVGDAPFYPLSTLDHLRVRSWSGAADRDDVPPQPP